MTTVSIALCTYNGEAHLEAQLQSIQNQSHPPDELIISDDGSTDRTLSIVRAFISKTGIKTHVQQNDVNLGYALNFGQAISLCTCDLVMLCDQDDIWLPNKIEVVRQAFDDNPNVGLVLHNFYWINEKGEQINRPPETYGPDHLTGLQLDREIDNHSISCFMLPTPRAWCGCMMAFRQKWTSLILPIYPAKGHDDWILKLLSICTRVKFIAQPLVGYRLHHTNINSLNRDMGRWRFFKIKTKKKLKNFWLGYNKKNFYTNVFRRITEQDVSIIDPELARLYKKHT